MVKAGPPPPLGAATAVVPGKIPDILRSGYRPAAPGRRRAPPIRPAAGTAWSCPVRWGRTGQSAPRYAGSCRHPPAPGRPFAGDSGRSGLWLPRSHDQLLNPARRRLKSVLGHGPPKRAGIWVGRALRRLEAAGQTLVHRPPIPDHHHLAGYG